MSALRVLQHNCNRSGEALVAVLETGIEEKADLVFLQEPPYEFNRHTGFQIFKEKKVWTAVRIDTKWKAEVNRHPEDTDGYTQVVDLTRKGHETVRVVNIYDQVNRETNRYVAHRGDFTRWSADNLIIAGDFNAHGFYWNDQLETEVRAGWLYTVIEGLDLVYTGDRVATRHGTNASNHSVIDLVFASVSMAARMSAFTMTDPASATGSDHRVLRWDIYGTRNGAESGEQGVRGWSIKEMCTPLTKEEKEEGLESGKEKAEKE